MGSFQYPDGPPLKWEDGKWYWWDWTEGEWRFLLEGRSSLRIEGKL